MEEIMDIIIRLAALLVMFAIGWVIEKVGNVTIKFLKGKLDEQGDAKLDKFIFELTAAADQLYKEADPDGSIRRDYVRSELIRAGYELSDAIIAKIEARVLYLPKEDEIIEEAGEDQ